MTVTAIKLTAPGSSLTMDVTGAALVPVGQYPEYEFVGLDGNDGDISLRVPQKSADRQLTRLHMTIAACVGKRLVFTRDPNASDPAKPYWGINISPDHFGALSNGGNGGGASPRPAAAPAAPPIPAPVSSPLASMFKIHDQCVEHAVTVTAKAMGNLATPESIMAAANTLFIQAMRH